MSRRVAVVVNPVHRTGRAAVRAVRARAAELGLEPPVVLTTSAADPGGGQARAALRSGATEVVVAGGDGTLRHVATELAGTAVPLGVLPTGTGNVLARSLGLPRTPAGAARFALGEHCRAIDLMRVRMDDGEPRLAVLLCGLGFDGRVMTGLREAVKLGMGAVRLGEGAYFVSAARALASPRFRARVTTYPGPGPEPGEEYRDDVVSVMVGNVGRLPPGVTLAPGARMDDGLLDVAVVRPRGLWGWGAVVAQTVAGVRGRRPVLVSRRGRRFSVVAATPQPAQIDGDAMGDVRRLDVEAVPRAVLVRVAA